MACQGCYKGWTLPSEIKIDSYSCRWKRLLEGWTEVCRFKKSVSKEKVFLKWLYCMNTRGWGKSEMRYLLNSFLRQSWFDTAFRCWSLLKSESSKKIIKYVCLFFFVCVLRFQGKDKWKRKWKIEMSFLCGFFHYPYISFTTYWGSCSHSELYPTWHGVLTFDFWVLFLLDKLVT